MCEFGGSSLKVLLSLWSGLRSLSPEEVKQSDQCDTSVVAIASSSASSAIMPWHLWC